MRQDTNRERVGSLMVELGKAVSSPGKIYFTGGVSAVLMGWREMTMDVDLKAEPEPAGFFESLPRLKDALDINIELAAPDQFVPALPGWQERSRFIARHGPLDFFHYDFYAQALAKIERDHARDRHDVARMLECGLVGRARLRELFEAIEPQLIRYPAIDAPTFRKRVLGIVAGDVELPPMPHATGMETTFADLPGNALVREGLADAARGRESIAACVVQIGSPRLRACGVAVPVDEAQALDADRRLYRLLAREHGNDAHSRYNALIRELISFERALEQRMSRAERMAVAAS